MGEETEGEAMRGFSFSWRRAVGLSAFKARLSRSTGVPFTRSGGERKIGRAILGWLFRRKKTYPNV